MGEKLKERKWNNKYIFENKTCIETEQFLYKYKKEINIIDKEDIYFSPLYPNSTSQVFYPRRKDKSKEKNILLVVHELSRTGAPVVALDTAKILVKNGYYVTVISPCDGPLLEEFIDIGTSVIKMPDLKYIQYLKMDSYQFQKQIDIDFFVKSFDLTIMVTATMYNIIRRYFNTNYKIIWWIHEGSASYNFLNQLMPKNITPNINVLCGGEYAVKQLKINNYHYYPKVLNYGVFDESKKYKKTKNNNQIVKFLLAGSIGTRKGQDLFLDAINELNEKYMNKSEFIFVGIPFDEDIDGKRILENIKETVSKKKNVKYISSIPREELYNLYQEIDVLVLASNDDPMPVVATENFMFKNICLCSTNTGTSYYIEDGINGFIFESGNKKELKEKIEHIINNSNELDTIKNKGRLIFDNYFDMKIFEKNILNVVREEL